jgi:hypothetical protein
VVDQLSRRSSGVFITGDASQTSSGGARAAHTMTAPARSSSSAALHHAAEVVAHPGAAGVDLR